MFTGIVETIGNVVNICQMDTSVEGGSGYSLTIGNCALILHDIILGDSIAVNGMSNLLVLNSKEYVSLLPNLSLKTPLQFKLNSKYHLKHCDLQTWEIFR